MKVVWSYLFLIGLKFKTGADDLKRRHLFHIQFDSNVVPFGNTLYISHHNICLLV